MYVPTLLAVSPLAAIRSAPVMTHDTSPFCISTPAAESAMSVAGIPNCWNSQEVSRAPCSQGRVSVL